MRNSRKASRVAAALAVAVGMLMAFAALGGVGLAQTAGGPGGKQYGKNKVAVCVKGKATVRVPKHTAAKLVAKGKATLGPCERAAKKNKGHKGKKGKKGQKAQKAAQKGQKAAEQGAKQNPSQGEHPGKGKGGKG